MNKLRHHFADAKPKLGTDDNSIDTDAFQVSDQCESLVGDSIITSSKDPLFMRLKVVRFAFFFFMN